MHLQLGFQHSDPAQTRPGSGGNLAPPLSWEEKLALCQPHPQHWTHFHSLWGPICSQRAFSQTHSGHKARTPVTASKWLPSSSHHHPEYPPGPASPLGEVTVLPQKLNGSPWPGAHLKTCSGGRVSGAHAGLYGKLKMQILFVLFLPVYVV